MKISISQRAIQLLAMLVLVAPAAPCFADSTATIADAHGCKTDNPNPKLNETISWTGGCKNGYLNGHGTLLWIRDAKPGSRYEGDFVNGELVGRGSMKTSEGTLYEGSFISSRLEGSGTVAYTNGTTITGNFANGQITGFAIAQYRDGSHFEGEWQFGSRSGHGVLQQKSGFRYDGGWLNNRYDGHGVADYPDGSRYEGTFVAGVREGHGVFEFRNGSRYVGDFKKNLFEGHGTWDTAFGQHLEGEFMSGAFVGDGAAPGSSQVAHPQLTDQSVNSLGSACNSRAVQKEVEYPATAMRMGILGGSVRAHFAIGQDGRVARIYQLETSNAAFDEVALAILSKLSCSGPAPAEGFNWNIDFLVDDVVPNPSMKVEIPADIRDGRRMLILIESASELGGDTEIVKKSRNASEQIAIKLSALLRARRISVAHNLIAVPVIDASRLLTAVTAEAGARYVVVIRTEPLSEATAQQVNLIVDFYALDTFGDARTAKPIASKSFPLPEAARNSHADWVNQVLSDVVSEVDPDNLLRPLEALCEEHLYPVESASAQPPGPF